MLELLLSLIIFLYVFLWDWKYICPLQWTLCTKGHIYSIIFCPCYFTCWQSVYISLCFVITKLIHPPWRVSVSVAVWLLFPWLSLNSCKRGCSCHKSVIFHNILSACSHLSCYLSSPGELLDIFWDLFQVSYTLLFGTQNTASSKASVWNIYIRDYRPTFCCWNVQRVVDNLTSTLRNFPLNGLTE